MSEKRFVYADNAATTSVHPRVLAEMLPYLGEFYGNPSSLYSKGQQVFTLLEGARARIAAILGCEAREIYFTGCGSEGDNWAIKGAVDAYLQKNKVSTCHVITTKIEHHAVLNTCKALEKKGIAVTYLDVDHDGKVNPEDVIKSLRDDTCIVAVMYANNEIGTIEPIAEIGEKIKEYNEKNKKKVLFFTDAVQAVGHVPIDIKTLHADMLSLSGHKFRAPKGVGALYIKSGVVIKSLIDGGGQERGKRGGTENVASIMGLAKALEIASEEMKDDNARLAMLRDELIYRLTTEIPEAQLTGHPTKRLPGTASFVFKYIEGESLLLMLDAEGICASTGSACSSKSLEPSHVLLAIGLPHEIAHGSLRLTLGYENTKEEMDMVVDNLKRIITNLRNMSPLYEDFVKKNHIQ